MISRSPINKTVMPGQGRSLGSIIHMELVEDGAGAFGQEKLLGDIGICETAGEKLQDSKLPFGQFSGDGNVRLDMLSPSPSEVEGWGEGKYENSAWTEQQ